ncbi:hypothetical protein DL96DRAFT_1614711, partial [Flagelloscypha sp. PMI_526]
GGSPWEASEVETADSETALRKELGSLFLSLRPFFQPRHRRLNTGATSRPPFRSVLVESGFISFNIAFGKESYVTIDRMSSLASSRGHFVQFWQYGDVDIQVELQDLDKLRPYPSSSALDPSTVVLEHIRDIVESVEHIVLLEAPEHGPVPSLPSLVPWIDAVSKSRSLKTLDARLTTCLQPLAWFLDQSRLQRLDGEQRPMTFPTMSKMTFRELRFNRLLQLRFLLLNERVENANSHLNSSPPLQTNTLQLDNIDSSQTPPAWQPQPLAHDILPSTLDFPSVFRARKAAGCPLQNLTFRNCASFDSSIFCHYQDAVGTVSWDGLESLFWDPWLSPWIPLEPQMINDHASSNESEEELL